MSVEENMSRVYVEPFNHTDQGLKFVWEGSPTVQDTRDAFQQINLFLDHSTGTVHLVVDIRNAKQFPLGATISRASSISLHKNMGNWLVIGSNPMAKVISRTMATFGKTNIIWFDTEEQAMAHLNELLGESETIN